MEEQEVKNDAAVTGNVASSRKTLRRSKSTQKANFTSV